MAILYTNSGRIATSFLRFLQEQHEKQKERGYREPDVQDNRCAEHQTEERLQKLSFDIGKNGKSCGNGTGLQNHANAAP